MRRLYVLHFCTEYFSFFWRVVSLARLLLLRNLLLCDSSHIKPFVCQCPCENKVKQNIRWCGSFFALGTAVSTFFTAISSHGQTTHVACFALTLVFGLTGLDTSLFGPREFSRLPHPVQRVLAKCRPMSQRPIPVRSLSVRFFRMIKSLAFRVYVQPWASSTEGVIRVTYQVAFSKNS